MHLLKELIWISSSLDDLREMPEQVRDDIGYSLYQAQMGLFPDYAKPLKGVGGVFEIISDFNTNTYRSVYATKLGSRIYVLHVFQKKSKSGIKTPKQEIDLIKNRLQQAKTIAKGDI